MSNKDKHDWKKEVKESQNYVCPICGKRGTDRTLNIHHKVAKSRHGTNTRENLVAWHVWCHREYHEKWGNKTSDDYGNPR